MMRALDSERAVVAAILVDPDRAMMLFDVVRADDFTDDFLRRAFAKITADVLAGQGVDPISIGTALGGVESTQRLLALMEDPSWQLDVAAHHARIVAVISRRRSAMAACQEFLADVQDTTTADEFSGKVAELQARLSQVADFGGGREATFKQAIVSALEYAEERTKNKNTLPGIPSGLKPIDDIMRGFRRKSLFVLAAQTGSGKSALALNFAVNTARVGAKVYYCSHEMNTLELGVRALASEARVGATRIEMGALESSDFARMMRVDTELPLVLNESPAQFIDSLRADCQRRKLKSGLDIIVVDYIQKMKSRERNKQPEQVIAEITDGLKRLAMDLDVCVIALSQLNNIAARNEEPELVGLRGSQAIAHDADQVLLVWAPDEKNDVVRFKFAKGRGGTVGDGELLFRRTLQKFEAKP